MSGTRLALAGCLCLGLTAVSHAEAAPDRDKASSKGMIVGVWEFLNEDRPSGATLEFTRDGKLKIALKIEEKTVTMAGTYALEGATLTTTFKDEDTQRTQKLKIKKLTDRELVMEDERGKTETLRKK